MNLDAYGQYPSACVRQIMPFLVNIDVQSLNPIESANVYAGTSMHKMIHSRLGHMLQNKIH